MQLSTYEKLILPVLEVICDGTICINKECEIKLIKVFKLRYEELNESLKVRFNQIMQAVYR